jgi:hypothetical protein
MAGDHQYNHSRANKNVYFASLKVFPTHEEQIKRDQVSAI